MPEGVTGLILAGGQSSRMGRDKASLPWGDSSLIKHVVETVRAVTDEVIVAVRDTRCFQDPNVKVVEDLVPGTHALGGLYTGLRMATHARCFVCACDAPFLSTRLIRFLIQQADGVDLVIPKTAQGLQPLHAMYATSALPVIEEQLQARRWDLRMLVPKLRDRIIEPETILRVDPEGLSFFNTNTPAEYTAARRLRSKMTQRIDPAQGLR